MRSGGAAIPVGVLFIVGGVYWFTLRPRERRWLVRRQFLKRPDHDMEVEWQIAPDRIRIQSGLGHSEFAWQMFAKMVRTPSGILFYSTEQVFHWLPRSGFASEADFERCIELARTKIERHYDVA